MLRIIQSRSINHAKSYFSTADYYSEGRETIGRWRGEGARLLGLDGTIKQSDWDALCDNRHPETGDSLTVRHKSDRTIGYDFNFHVPKSVSLLYATTKDERMIEAFRDAVDGTMHDMEEEMATRVRQGGKNENRRTSNMIWGEYVHLTSRPVDGVPDPLLHAHCYVFNTTFDQDEERWKAGQFRELKRDAPYFEAVFHSRFAHQLGELGLPIERTATGWELEGINRDLVEKFSRRTQQIEKMAQEMGITDAETKAELGAKTREHKQKNLKFEELQTIWRERMTDEERSSLDALAAKIGGDAEPADDTAAARAVEYATGHVFERKSVAPERHLLATALKQSVGEATVEQVEREADASGLIVGERNGRRMVTTRDVLAEEQRVIDFARDGRGTCKPFEKHHDRFARDWLNDAQKNAVRHILESRDRVTILRGAAGVGKTTLMQEAVEAIEETGTRVFAFAPSTDASRVVLRDAGFKDAETVATLLVNERLQEKVAGQLIWIDEASLLDTETTAKVFSLAERREARVLLSGDRYQHGSVGRGDMLRMLETEAGLKPAEVKEIQRQAGAYKEAVKALSEHRIADGYERLDELGWIKELPYSERYKQIAADYFEAANEGKSALVVCPTHLEGERITAEIRRSLREAGALGQVERTFTRLEHAHLTEAQRGDPLSYAPGDVLVFHQNAKGFSRGDRLTVGDDTILPLNQAARFQVFHSRSIELAAGDTVRITKNGISADGNEHRLNNGSVYRIKRFDDDGNIVFENGWKVGREFGHLAHGYVVTSHASQGKTVDRVFVAQGRVSFAASSSEQFYVSASRAREQVTIYTEDREELLDAVSRSDERLTATDLVNGIPQRQLAELRAGREPFIERQARDREELIHER
jgi:conjugative relaxase-like TrwC/TraI family protein